MTLQLIIEMAWKSSLTLGLTLVLLRLLEHRSAAERSWIAHAGLAATLLLPIAATTAPRWQVEAPAPVASVLASGDYTSPAPVQPAPATVAAAPRPAVATVDPAGAAEPSPAYDPVLLLYGLPAALLLTATAIAILRLFTLRGRANVLVEQTWLSALALAQRRMGFKHGTALLVSDDIASPVSWGVLRPVILLNDEAVASRDQAEAIIAHELAHVARLDWAKLLLARVATALFWFNPLVWLLARQCHQLREEAADDAVLASDVPDIDYAELLVGVARHESGALLLAANGVAPGKGSLKRRVERVLDAGRRRAPPRAVWTTACAMGALMVATPLAALALTEAVPVTPPIKVATAVSPSPVRAARATTPATPATPVTPVPSRAGRVAEPVTGSAAHASAPTPPVPPATLDTVELAALPAPVEWTDGSESLPPFSAVSIRGGGKVIVRYGKTRSVRTISGSPRIDISDDNVAIADGDDRTVVEIVTPRLEAIAIKGGGSVAAQGAFPRAQDLAVAINGGGSVDVQAIEADEVAAAVRGGGSIKTRVRRELAANVTEGGSILYWGNPSDVSSSASKGGTIERAGS
jgi:beta-lactamase regulating signal transducer with metallopeptidase domain